MCGSFGGAELQRAPDVHQPAVGVVECFHAPPLEWRASQQHGSRTGKRLDIATRVTQCAPDDRRGSTFAAKVRGRVQ